jgi:hypothetical protein
VAATRNLLAASPGSPGQLRPTGKAAPGGGAVSHANPLRVPSSKGLLQSKLQPGAAAGDDAGAAPEPVGRPAEPA